jgi:hypothetical protein
MLAKMCGWNEPEKQQVQHIHLQVDSALIEQLRADYAEMNAGRVRPVAANSEANRIR